MSLSCCVRRDLLTRLRENGAASSAGQAVHAHILASCPGAVFTIGGATLDGEWLAAGGISMALQSNWLFASELARFDRWDRAARIAAGSRYSKVWNTQFATRIRAAAVLACIAVLPHSTAVIKAFIGWSPVV
ncbi:hypothetical protein BPNPMPFG_008379 (plasmid) [Mesorhizobium sp. AR07]|uniref:hypothetical protein n=1 Tax=Mesorhizobium sp. AR07 TaxID=2865838 RepID=UPI00215E7B9E|nr:hypothetical protein [Mesorhizobium sp. AR07]UVK49412.1 hypothetical protein BPNPMPFG_008379 [Mesorhizobium sp. AR07]